MLQIAKAAALVAVTAASSIVALRLRVAPPGTTVVVQHDAWLPQRMVRITQHDIFYQGTSIAMVPACPDSPCFRLDALYQQLEESQPAVPRGAFVPARLVLVDVDDQTDLTTERQVLNAIALAGFWPVVTYGRL